MKRRSLLIGGVGAVAAAAGVGGALWTSRRSAAQVDPAFWALRFERPEGGELALASLRGRPVLLNFWATWCAPCREEMPGLDRLQGLAGNPSFSVVAVNMDTARLDRPQKFLQETGVKKLGFYADPKGKALQVLQQAGKLVGLPTTFLIGPDGCVIGAMAGPAKWDGADAQALARAAAQQ